LPGWDPFRDSFRILDRFGGRFRGLMDEGDDDESAKVPAADVFEDREGTTYSVELPGVAQEALALTLGAGTLVVEAERAFGHLQQRRVERLECRWGRLRRTFVLRPDAQPENAVAELNRGVLRVFVPTRPPAATTVRRVVPAAGDEPAAVPLG